MLNEPNTQPIVQQLAQVGLQLSGTVAGAKVAPFWAGMARQDALNPLKQPAAPLLLRQLRVASCVEELEDGWQVRQCGCSVLSALGDGSVCRSSGSMCWHPLSSFASSELQKPQSNAAVRCCVQVDRCPRQLH